MENISTETVKQSLHNNVPTGGLNFRIQNIVVQDNDLLLYIIMNERDFVLTIDKESFDNWFTQGTGLYNYVMSGWDNAEQGYKEVSGEIPINEWWADMNVNNVDHNKYVAKFIEQDGYLKGALTAQYIHDTILYDELTGTELNDLLIKYQGLIRDMFATNMLNRLESHTKTYSYTKEIKIG